MLGKKFKSFLVIGMVCLSLIIGQGVVWAADKEASDNISISQKIPYGVYFITGDGVNIRSQANTSSTILGQLYKKDTISIVNISSDGNWVYGTASTKVTGWVSISYVDIAGGPID